jgi:hypothetical protein
MLKYRILAKLIAYGGNMELHEIIYDESTRVAVVSSAEIAQQIIDILGNDLYAKSGFEVKLFYTGKLGEQMIEENRRENNNG